MCGIFVVIPKKENHDYFRAKIALDKLKKRGPDYNFIKIIKNIFFGQTILSMSGSIKKNINNHISKSKNFFLVFNGEIYNYKYLLNKFALFNNNKNHSDTEVLVNIFDKIDIKAVNKELDGMYAYTLFDKKKNKIYICRDPQGEKSLYKFEDHKYIIISSEIEPILYYTKKNLINENLLKTYFYSRHFIQFDKTIYKNIEIVNPGELLEISLNDYKLKKIDSISITSFVDNKIYNENLKKKEDNLLDELDFLIEKNIKEMIPNNRNFASIVSGGIDSTLISSYLDEYPNAKKLICLNHIGKDKISNNISKFNKYFSKKINKFNINSQNYFKNLIESTKINQSPINSHDFVGKLILAKETKKNNCKAIFGGDGADEFFGGYKTYNQEIINYDNVSDYTKLINKNFFYENKELKYFKRKLDFNWSESLQAYNFIKNKQERVKLSMMLMDGLVQLPSVGLRGTDLMSMSESIEPRSLFLRKEIINFALNLPLKYKIFQSKKKFINKYLLKKLFIRKFSKKLIYKKQGFAGFPNDTKKYLPAYGSFKIRNYDKKFKKLKFNKLTNALKWKILNVENFLNIHNKTSF